MREQWRPVPGYEGHYSISDLGHVANIKYGYFRRVKPYLVGRRDKEYEMVELSLDGKAKAYGVHRLVLLAFVGESKSDQVCRHKNGNPTDNRLSNLQWGSVSENALDSVQHKTHHFAAKTHCKRGHPLSGENLRIEKSSGARVCKTCKNMLRQAARNAAKLTDPEQIRERREKAAINRGNANKRRAKLSEDQKAELVRLRDCGLTYAELAAKFGVSTSLVCLICKSR